MRIVKRNIPLLIVLLLAIITFIVGLLFKSDHYFTEKVYSQNIYPHMAAFLSSFSSLFSFSIDDVFYILLILFIPVSILLLVLKKLKWRILVKCLLLILGLSYIGFYWFWGFNYYRIDIHQRLGVEKSVPELEVFKKVFAQVIENANNSYINADTIEVLKYQKLHEESFKNLSDFLKLKYPSGKRRVKEITFSDFFAKATIAGYFGPFFNEVHVNKNLSKWDVPLVTAHEMSHQFGITSEAEANFYAWIICINSSDKFDRYSGWLFVLNNFLYQANGVYSKDELLSKIRPEVVSDLRRRIQHWNSFRVENIDKVASRVNDAYLKSNDVKKGIKDYNAVVQLVVDVYLSNGDSFAF